jgi:cytochrome P450
VVAGRHGAYLLPMTVTDDTPGDLYYDPIDVDIDADVHSVWRRLRDEAPLYWNDKYEFFAVSRYDDVLRAVLDTDTFSSAHGTTIDMMGPDRLEQMGLKMMIFMDPPEHSWHRKVVNRAFTPRTVAALEDRLIRLSNSLLDRIDGQAEFDFVQDYGAIIPPTMILALVGFPEGYEDEWRRGVDSMLSVSPSGEPQSLEAREQAIIGDDGALGSSLFQMLPELIEERRKAPQDDLMSVLVESDLDEDGTVRKLSNEEILSFVLLLSAAGTETVARLLGWAGSLLDQHPDQRAELVADPSLIPNAVEECLRYEAPSPVNGRWVMSDVEFQGRTVPAGSRLLMLNGSANRDERHFADADRFDVHRTIDRHLSFGYGAHFCVGAALARIEGHIAIREMLQRHPTWEVDRSGAEMIQTTTVRGFSKLPVRV